MSRGTSKPDSPGPVGVIDIGSTSIRMVVAQVRDGVRIETLEFLEQELSIGKDVFAGGAIKKETVEDCVKIVRSFRKVLEQYRIEPTGRVRAFATSAVREAENRDAFLDRIYIATGVDIETIDDAEINRYTYLSVRPFLESHPLLRGADVLVIEIGGGSTELMLIQKGRLAHTHTLRFGSYRVRETLEQYGAMDARLFGAMEIHVQNAVGAVQRNVGGKRGLRMLAMGGDLRFAASQIMPEWDRGRPAILPVKALNAFTRSVASEPPDKLVRRFHIGYPDAEILGPALLTYGRLASAFRLHSILVAPCSMRDGAVLELSSGMDQDSAFQEQVVSAAKAVGEKYAYDSAHAGHVTMICRRLFASLKEVHSLPQSFELLLAVAAILHDIGFFISGRSHHKHTMYLIMNCGLFGLGPRDLRIAALVARYHRMSPPLSSHEEFSSLDRDGRIIVSKLAAMIRVADALDSSHKQRIRSFDMSVDDDGLRIAVHDTVDLTVETMSMRDKGDLFEQVFGMGVHLSRG